MTPPKEQGDGLVGPDVLMERGTRFAERYLEEARKRGIDPQEIRLALKQDFFEMHGLAFERVPAPYNPAPPDYLNAKDLKRWQAAQNVLERNETAVEVAYQERYAASLPPEALAGANEAGLPEWAKTAAQDIPSEVLAAAREWRDKPTRFQKVGIKESEGWTEDVVAWELPGSPEAVAVLERLAAKARKAYEKVLAKPRPKPDLKGFVSPGAYFRRRKGEEWFWALQVLDLLLSRMEADALRQQMRRARKGIPEVLTVPQHLLDNVTAYRETWAEQLDAFTEGQRLGMVTIVGNKRDLRDTLEAQVSTVAEPSNWDLTTPEWRALWAIYGILSAEGVREDGFYIRSIVPEDWSAIYAAAGLPVGEDSKVSHFRRTEIQEALRSLCEKHVPVYMVRKRDDGLVDMAARSAPILQRLAMWDGKTEAEAERIRELPPDAWEVQPDRWAYGIIPELRQPGGYFREIPSDTPYRLEGAAAEVVGQNRGLQPREFNFLMWLYKQRPQHQGGRFFVDVDLNRVASIIPGLRTYLQARQRQRLRDNATKMYEIFTRAGILTGYETDFITSRRGLRDRLYLNPERFPQLARRRLEAETVPLALPAGKAPKRRKKGAQA